MRGGAGNKLASGSVSQGTEHQPGPAEMPGTPTTLLSGHPWTSGIHRGWAVAAGSWPPALSEGTQLPSGRNLRFAVPSIASSVLGLGAQWWNKRGAAILREVSQAGVGPGTPGSGAERGPFWRKRQQRSWAGGWGPWAAGIQTSTLPPGGGGGRRGSLLTDATRPRPRLPSALGARPNVLPRAGDNGQGVPSCMEPGGRRVIRALALGLELRARPGFQAWMDFVSS